MLKPIARLSVSEAVFQQLRDAILDGQFSPGQTLPGERVLATTLGANRGAVREALKRLEQAGLVVTQQGDGTRVLDYRASAQLDLLPHLLRTKDGQANPEVVESYAELCALMLREIAGAAARKHSRDHARQIEALLHETELSAAARSAEAQREWQRRFWSELVDASGNIAYRLILNTLHSMQGEDGAPGEPALQFDFPSYRELARLVLSRQTEAAAAQTTAMRFNLPTRTLSELRPRERGGPAERDTERAR